MARECSRVDQSVFLRLVETRSDRMASDKTTWHALEVRGKNDQTQRRILCASSADTDDESDKGRQPTQSVFFRAGNNCALANFHDATPAVCYMTCFPMFL